MDRLAYTVPEVLEAVGISRTKLYEVIGAGDLRARKLGTRTVILKVDLDAWLDRLPIIGDEGAGK